MTQFVTTYIKIPHKKKHVSAFFTNKIRALSALFKYWYVGKFNVIIEVPMFLTFLHVAWANNFAVYKSGF
jgi:hypothetical protein